MLLTFDDGPTRRFDDILCILNEKNVLGVFYWQSRLLHPTRPWKRLLEHGHILGTHGHRHLKLSKLSADKQYHEIEKGKNQLEALIGQKVTWFRPPFGIYNEDTIAATKKLGLSTMMWHIASWDWKHEDSPEQILTNVLDNVSGGNIILLHELPQTVKILPELIDRIREKGLDFCAPHESNIAAVEALSRR